MRTKAIVVVLGVFIAFAAPAANVTDAELKRFVAEKPKIYDTGAPSEEVLRLLMRHLPKQGYASAVDELAKAWAISRASADEAAASVIRSELYLFDDDRRGSKTRKSPRELLLNAIERDVQSPKLWGMLREVLTDQGGCENARLAARYFAQSWAGAEFVNSEDYYCKNWILEYAKREPMTMLAYWRVASLFNDEGASYRLAALAQMLKELRKSEPRSDLARFITRTYWAALAQADLGSEIVNDGGLLAQDLVADILDAGHAGDIQIGGVQIAPAADNQQSAIAARDAWLLSLIDAGRRADAQSWLSVLKIPRPRFDEQTKQQDDRNAVFADKSSDANEFLHRAVMGARQNDIQDDIYDLFVGNGERGLQWSVGHTSPLAEHASIALFTESGYADIGRDLIGQHCDKRRRKNQATSLTQGVAVLPAEFLRDAGQFAGSIDHSPAHERLCKSSAELPDDTAMRATYVEHELPAEQRSHHAAEKADDATAIKGLESAHVVRVDRRGVQWAAISISNVVDPTGEVGLGGYWLHLSHDKGRTWSKPIYTGLKYMQPYIVPRNSKLPLIDGHTLKLEILVKELDERSITFPPVGLATKREQEGLYIELDVDDLQRDSDGDGLTDLLEAKLRTDPHKRDSDGDGLDDGFDPFPQVSVREPPHRDVDVIKLAIQRVLGYERAAIKVGAPVASTATSIDSLLGSLGQHAGSANNVLFVEADPELFKGIMLPGTIIVLNQADTTALRARFGVFYPLHFPSPWFNRSHTKAILRWSAGWVGGTLLFEKGARGWTQKEVSSWIT